MKLCGYLKCNPLGNTLRAPTFAPLTLTLIGGWLAIAFDGLNQFTGLLLLTIGLVSLISRALQGLCCPQQRA
jgi:hypothetical protein